MKQRALALAAGAAALALGYLAYRRFRKPRLTITVCKDKVALGQAAAEHVAEVITSAVASKGAARVIVATGASQFEFLAALVSLPVPWDKVTFFHLDEYVGLEPTHPASFRLYLRERLFSKLTPPPAHVHYVDPACIEEYAFQLAAGPIDLACIGIGENGHIAFNDPPPGGADFHDPKLIKKVELDAACRQQQLGEGWFPTLDAVPTHAITLTVPAIMQSAAISCVVPDERKAQAVHDTMTAAISEACASACAAVLAEGGCSAFMPTVITASLETYEHVLPLIADVIEAEAAREGAAQLGPCVGRLLGIHMEGPFISAQPGAVGAHPPQHVLTPAHCPEGGRALLRRWRELSRGHLQLITVAAEVEGAPELIEYARSLGLRVSLGHMTPSRAELLTAAESGATLLTHLGNGCPNMLPRHHNHLWPSLVEDRLVAMLITDGQHLPDDTITAVLRAKGVARVLVTSDAAPVAGLPDGQYDCFGGTVRVEGRFVRSADRSCLAGSGALMLDCLNHLARLTIWPPAADGAAAQPLSLAELMQLGFDNPLRAIGLDPHEARALLTGASGRGLWLEFRDGQFHA